MAEVGFEQVVRYEVSVVGNVLTSVPFAWTVAGVFLLLWAPKDGTDTLSEFIPETEFCAVSNIT
jgi:hypothetical protein